MRAVSQIINELGERMPLSITIPSNTYKRVNVGKCDICGAPVSALKDKYGNLSDYKKGCRCWYAQKYGIDQYTFDRFDKQRDVKSYNSALQYCENDFSDISSGKKSLIFVGINGSGKSHLAGAVCNFRLQRNLGYFIYLTVGALASNLKSNNYYWNNYAQASFLVLDDFGRSSRMEWIQDIMFEIVNYRYVNRLHTIFTTEFNSEQLNNIYGGGTIDRVVGMSKVVKMQAESSYRK